MQLGSPAGELITNPWRSHFILSHKDVTPLGGKEPKALTGIEQTGQHKLPQDPSCFNNGQSDAWLLILWEPGCASSLRGTTSTHCESKTDVGRIEESTDRGQVAPSLNPTLLDIFWGGCHVLTSLKAKKHMFKYGAGPRNDAG